MNKANAHIHLRSCNCHFKSYIAWSLPREKVRVILPSRKLVYGREKEKEKKKRNVDILTSRVNFKDCELINFSKSSLVFAMAIELITFPITDDGKIVPAPFPPRTHNRITRSVGRYEIQVNRAYIEQHIAEAFMCRNPANP